jgi:hypothetical protein
MLLRFSAALIVLLLSAHNLAQVGNAGCLSYEPALVALRGVLGHATFPGPPNYENARKGDKAETYWFLTLDSPTCVDEDKSQSGLNPRQRNIRKMQLVLKPGMYEKYRGLVGKRVVATGILFGAHTAHHHTPVLLTVRDIKKGPDVEMTH